jgi:methionine biosynthesis protein MetW
MHLTGLRPDQSLITQWIKPGSKVLDIGCGDGALLQYLMTHHGVEGYGLELDPTHVSQSIRSGINVIQTDAEAGLPRYFADHSFDVVIMTQSLQVMHRPDWLLGEILRIAEEGIVTFPNFGFWKHRLQLGLYGRMPVSETLPEQWYDTSNIHLYTLQDFEDLCQKKSIQIRQRKFINQDHNTSLGTRLFPNLFAEIALYRLSKSL